VSENKADRTNKKHSGSGKTRGLRRREVLGRFVTGGAATVSWRAFGSPGTPAAGQAPASNSGPTLGCAEPPDPSLSAPDWTPRFFDAHQNETVVVLSDLIIPATDTPGAKAAQVNRFIDLLLAAQPPEQQKEYLQALAWLDGYCLNRYGQPFTGLGEAMQKEVLTLLTHPNSDPQLAEGIKLFGILKGSIAGAYYSSEIGMLQELKYQTNPFQPDFPGCPHDGHH
jgi:hypothetical protein